MKPAALCAIAVGMILWLPGLSQRSAVGADPPTIKGKAGYVGTACFIGVPSPTGHVIQQPAGRTTTLDSQAKLTLNFDAGKAVGLVYLKNEYRAKGAAAGVVSWYRYGIDARLPRLSSEPPRLGWRALTLNAVEMTGRGSAAQGPNKTKLYGTWFRQADLTVPGHEKLRDDFILLYRKPGDYGCLPRDLAAAVRQGKLGRPLAVLWPASRSGGADDPGSATPGWVGERTTRRWVVTHAGGPVEARAGGGKWRKLTTGMRIGKNVEIRTGERGIVEIKIQGKTKAGKPYTQAESRLGPHGSLRIRDPDASEPRIMFFGPGGIMWDRVPGAAGPSPIIETPTARVTPVGTRFRVDYDPQARQTKVAVEAGKVRVTPTHPGLPPQTLGAGEEATVGVREMTLTRADGPKVFRAPDEPTTKPATGSVDRAQADDGGAPAQVWIPIVAGGAVVLLVVVLIAIAASRKRRSAPPPG